MFKTCMFCATVYMSLSAAGVVAVLAGAGPPTLLVPAAIVLCLFAAAATWVTLDSAVDDWKASRRVMPLGSSASSGTSSTDVEAAHDDGADDDDAPAKWASRAIDCAMGSRPCQDDPRASVECPLCYEPMAGTVALCLSVVNGRVGVTLDRPVLARCRRCCHVFHAACVLKAAMNAVVEDAAPSCPCCRARMR